MSLIKDQIIPHTWYYNSACWTSILVNFHQLLEVDETVRLGSQGPDSVKSHQWFAGVDWKGIRERNFPIPHEITTRINQHLEIHAEDLSGPLPSPSDDVPELNTSEWLEDWWKDLKQAVFILDGFKFPSTMAESVQIQASELHPGSQFYLQIHDPWGWRWIFFFFCHFAVKFKELVSAFHFFSFFLDT